MDIISKGDRQKLYYQGLEKASEYHLPDMDELLTEIRENQLDPELEAACRELLFLLCNVYVPLYRVISYVIKNRLIHECMGELAEQARENPVHCTPDDIFYMLCRVEPFSAEEIIRTIDTDSATLERLRQCFQNHDREAFAVTINENRCGLQTISWLSKFVWTEIDDSLSQTIEAETFAMALDAMAMTNTKGLVKSEQVLFRSMERMSDEFLKTIDDGGSDDQHSFIVYRECIRDTFIWLREFYYDNIKSFKLRERRIIDSILARPEATSIPLVHEIDGDGFSLPADYFSHKSELGHSDEHFNLRHEVVAAGPERFTELINYLSENGYIENSIAVKQLFAYRFSGRMRPEIVVPIEWYGRNDKSYELIYLVRNLCPRGDYVKMKRFFFGPDWVKIDDSGYSRDSCYSKDADRDLKEYLKKLYPTIPDQL